MPIRKRELLTKAVKYVKSFVTPIGEMHEYIYPDWEKDTTKLIWCLDRLDEDDTGKHPMIHTDFVTDDKKAEEAARKRLAKTFKEKYKTEIP